MRTADPAHPSPFLQRPVVLLDGPWACTIDSGGSCRGPSDPPFSDTIDVPFAPETPASGIAHEGRVGSIWYRRSLDTAVAEPHERIILHFAGVDRTADVWVDGHHVGAHVGGYAPFDVDITEHARPGAELVVRATDDPDDLEVPRGKQEWRDRPHAIWYPRTTGIWKSSWIERVPRTRIVDLSWTSDPGAMTVTLRARVEGPLAADARVGVRLTVGDRLLVDDDIAVRGPIVERTFAIGDGGFDDRVALVWFPARPTLIDAAVTLRAGDAVVDDVISYTALRSVDVVDGKVRLNGRPYPLRLVLDQGYWPETGATPPDVDALRRDIELAKALGFNGVRKHQKTEDPRYFALADRLGLLTWVEMPSAYRPGDRTARSVVAEWAEIVCAHRNHPSVIAWVPVNESWGVPACATDVTQRALIEALTALTRALDPTRPISANDGWETVGGDIVGVHDYDQDPAVLANRWGHGTSIDAILTTRRPDGKLADLDRAPAGGRAVVLSEFGGIALASDADDGPRFGSGSWGYDDADSPEDLLGRYRSQWAAVHSAPGLAGACWTQLTDTYQEVNGLLRMDRTPKVDVAAMAAATKGRPVD